MRNEQQSHERQKRYKLQLQLCVITQKQQSDYLLDSLQCRSLAFAVSIFAVVWLSDIVA